MKDINNAVELAITIANDDSHGYSQINRNGNPDYDCSALIIDVLKKSGFNLSCTYTGNMFNDLIKEGFKVVSDKSLQRGDILLNIKHHVAIMINSTQLVEASNDEKGGIGIGAMPGDQTGKEICIRNYYDYPWDYILRYKDTENNIVADHYIVKSGDTFWGIAEKYNLTINQLKTANPDIKDINKIFVGDEIIIPSNNPLCMCDRSTCKYKINERCFYGT